MSNANQHIPTVAQGKDLDAKIKISKDILDDADEILLVEKGIKSVLRKYPNEVIRFDEAIAQDNPVADYIKYSTTHCIGLPINVSYSNLEKFCEMHASNKPTNIRLYVEENFSETNLEKIKNLFLNNFDNVYFTEISGLTEKDMDNIEEFTYTYFADQQVHNDTDAGRQQHQAAKENAEKKKRQSDVRDRHIFGNNVKNARIQAKMGVNDLAEKINMKPSYVLDIERGEIYVDNAMKSKIAFAFGKTVIELISGNTESARG